MSPFSSGARKPPPPPALRVAVVTRVSVCYVPGLSHAEAALRAPAPPHVHRRRVQPRVPSLLPPAHDGQSQPCAIILFLVPPARGLRVEANGLDREQLLMNISGPNDSFRPSAAD